MDKNEKEITIKEIFYYIAVIMLLATKGFGLDESEFSFRILMVAGCIFMMIKMLLDEYDIREIAGIALLILWGIFTYYNTGSLGLFIYLILIVGMKGIPLKRLFKVAGLAYGVFVFITVTAAIFGNRRGVVLIHEKFGLGPLLRESLGYTHPNVLHVTYVVFMAFVLYNCHKEGKELLKVILLLLVGDLFIFMYSLSSTGLIMSVFYLFLHVYLINRKQLYKLEKGLLAAFIPGCAVLPIVFSFLNENTTVFKVVNHLFNNRIVAIKIYFKDQGLSLFGEMSRVPEFSLDNSFASALFGYGIVFFLIIVAAYYLLIRYLIQKDMRREIAILCAFFWGGISEPFLFNASVKNITVFFLGYYMYDRCLKNGNMLPLLSHYNEKISIEDILNEKKWTDRLQWGERVLQIMGIVAALFLFIILIRPVNHVNNVYASQKLCDCSGEKINVNDIEKNGDDLYIGEMVAGETVYHFSEENSRLIGVMHMREKISILTYLIGDIALLKYSILQKKKKYK